MRRPSLTTAPSCSVVKEVEPRWSPCKYACVPHPLAASPPFDLAQGGLDCRRKYTHALGHGLDLDRTGFGAGPVAGPVGRANLDGVALARRARQRRSGGRGSGQQGGPVRRIAGFGGDIVVLQVAAGGGVRPGTFLVTSFVGLP